MRIIFIIFLYTLFPIGHLKKAEVRELARSAGLAVSEKKDSTGICFVGEVPIKELLAEFVAPSAGDIITTDGKKIGQHDGLFFYTIGQRHGFGVTGGGTPLYVVRKNFETNELVVGDEHDPALFSTRVVARAMHWIHKPLNADVKVYARFRHRQALQEVGSWEIEGDNIILKMKDPQRAITSGQFAVVYHGTECLGGGIINE
jgi:tRNA-uridine 2-sulfurtransferase